MAAPILESEVLASLPPPEARSFLRAYVEYAMTCSDAHAAYQAAGGLVVLAQTCPIDYSFPYGMPMPFHVYALCVGTSADARKSAGITVARDILDTALPDAIGEVPGSREKLIDSLRAKPRQAILFSEFGAFLASAEQGYLNPLKTTFTEAWDGTPLGRALIKKADTEARSPRMSMLCGSTLDYLERHTDPADWTGGFMGRYITFYGDRTRDFDVPPGNPAMRGTLIEWVRNLATFSTIGVQRGQCLGFSPTARELWKVWYNSLSQHSRSSGIVSETASAVSRAHAHALRIAMLLAWDYGYARSGYDWYITENELVPALRLIGLHLRSVQRIGEGLSTSMAMRDRRAVLNAIKTEPTAFGQIITDSRLLQRRVSEILESLMSEGIIEVVTDVSFRVQHFKKILTHRGWIKDPPPMMTASNVIPLFQQPQPQPQLTQYPDPNAAQPFSFSIPSSVFSTDDGTGAGNTGGTIGN